MEERLTAGGTSLTVGPTHVSIRYATNNIAYITDVVRAIANLMAQNLGQPSMFIQNMTHDSRDFLSLLLSRFVLCILCLGLRIFRLSALAA